MIAKTLPALLLVVTAHAAGPGSGASALPHAASPATPTAPLSIPVPRGWDERVAYGGAGDDPTRVKELIAANVPLSPAVTGCGGTMPQLAPRDVLLRVYDYGATAPMPHATRPVAVLRMGRIHGPLPLPAEPLGVSSARFRYRGHLVVVDAAFGARHPPRAVLRAARWVLAGARYEA